MIYVTVSIFLTVLVPIATGIFYALIKEDNWDPEFDAVIFFIVGIVVAWGWPLVLPLASIIAVVLGMVAGTAKMVEKIKSNRE